MPFQITVREPLANSSNNLYSAEPPIGSIIAWHPRLFSGAANSGIGTSDRIQLPANWCLCDGRDLSANPLTKDSPLIDAGFKRVPDITDNRFLMGGLSTSFLGDNYVYGGTNHAGPPATNDNNGDNSITISTVSLPPHTHGVGSYSLSGTVTTNTTGSHSHRYTAPFDSQNADSGGTGLTGLGRDEYASTVPAGSHSHTLDTSLASIVGSSADGSFSNTAVSVIPKYLLTKFIMRVK